MIEVVLLSMRDDRNKEVSGDQSAGGVHNGDSASRKCSSLHNQGADMTLTTVADQKEMSLAVDTNQEEPMHLRAAEWAQMLEALTQRRTEVLTPENLENMWTKGRHYKKKEQKNMKTGVQEHVVKGSGINSALPNSNMGKEMLTNRTGLSAGTEEKAIVKLTPGLSLDAQISDGKKNETQLQQNFDKSSSFDGGHVNVLSNTNNAGDDGNKSRLKRSSSTSALKVQSDSEKAFTGDVEGPIIAEFYSPDFGRHSEEYRHKNASDVMLRGEGQHGPKLKCRVSIFT